MQEFKGIVNRRHGGYFYVLDQDQSELPCKLKGSLKKDSDLRNLCVVGDRVSVELDDDALEGTITEIHERASFLRRAKGFQRKSEHRQSRHGQILISNIDQVILMIPAREPKFHPLLLDRFLIMVEAMELPPVIILNKWDLLKNRRKEEMEEFVNLYSSIGYTIIPCSFESGLNLDKIHSILDNKVTFMMGPSGAGKSTLANHFNQNLQLRTGIWSKKCKTGPQTTTATALYPLWENTFLADTAGFSQVYLFHLSKYVLREYYPEYRNLPPCLYSDCLHNGDDGCLVEEKIKDGSLDLERWNRYRQLISECNEQFPEYEGEEG
jgi:ribosome biogenesis GTPase